MAKPYPFIIANYVFTNYGTGAIMAVPAHDTEGLRVRPKI